MRSTTPLPKLRTPGMGGYVVDRDKDRLRGAPSFSRNETPEWNREWGTRVDDYYGVPSY